LILLRGLLYIFAEDLRISCLSRSLRGSQFPNDIALDDLWQVEGDSTAVCQDQEVTYLNSLGYNNVAEPTATLNPLEVLGQNSGGVLNLGPLSPNWTISTTAPQALSSAASMR